MILKTIFLLFFVKFMFYVLIMRKFEFDFFFQKIDKNGMLSHHHYLNIHLKLRSVLLIFSLVPFYKVYKVTIFYIKGYFIHIGLIFVYFLSLLGSLNTYQNKTTIFTSLFLFKFFSMM